MPLVTCYCRRDDGNKPAVYVKIKGKFYRTGIRLDYFFSYRSGWTSSSPMALTGRLTAGARIELRAIVQKMLDNPKQEQWALQGEGLHYCGLRLTF